MPYQVFLTADAERDLADIYGYIAAHDAPDNADLVLDRIGEVVGSLCEFPDRGTYPKELDALGIREYREVFFKPYRVIYRVLGKRVYIYLIADGRRDMRTLLERRITAP